MAPRPDLYPLKTPKNLTFPSELQEYLRPANAEPARCNDGKGPSVPPPLAYTEFLKALSPVFGSPPASANTAYSGYSINKQLPSPQSLPSTASTTSSFPGDASARPASRTHARTRSGPPTPMNAPRSAVENNHLRRLRPSPSYSYSPTVVMDSPRSAHPARSPYPPLERRMRYVESPTSATSRSITIQHVVTQTVTLKRVPSLAPPPKGKRRRTAQAKQ